MGLHVKHQQGRGGSSKTAVRPPPDWGGIWLIHPSNRDGFELFEFPLCSIRRKLLTWTWRWETCLGLGSVYERIPPSSGRTGTMIVHCHEKLYGSGHPALATTLSQLSGAYGRLGQLSRRCRYHIAMT
eukprot:2453813-Amphidinium_carterae.1